MAKKKRIEKKVKIGDKRVSVYGFSAYEVAQKIEALKGNMEKQKYPLFNEVLNEWRTEHFKDIALGTQTCYKPAIKRAEQEFGEVRICDITPMDITDLLAQLGKLGYSLQTVKVQRIVLKLVFKYAQSKGIVNNNPAVISELPSKLPKQVRQLPDDDVIDIVMKSSHLTFGVFPLFLLLTGCRRGEALALKWRDIDFDRKTIDINKKIVYSSNQPILEHHTKTSAGMRKIILLDAIEAKLRELKGNASPDDYIFGADGQPLTNTQFRIRWNKYIKEAGIDITPHQLRHAYATILYDAKIDEKAAQSFMGHSTIEITHNIYTHIRQKKALQAQDALNNYIANNLS